MEEGTRAYLLAPIIRDRKGEYKKEFIELRKQGYQRVKVNGTFHELEEPPVLDKKFRHNIDVVVDRIVVREGIETRYLASNRPYSLLNTYPERKRIETPYLVPRGKG